MRKLIRLYFIAALLSISLSLPAWAGGTAAGPRCDRPQALVNEEFTVGIAVYGVDGMLGSSFEIAFDPAKLAVAGGVYDGDIFNASNAYIFLNEVDNGAGAVRYTALMKEFSAPFTGAGTIAGLRFKALAPGKAEIGFKTDSDICPGGLMIVGGEFKTIPAEAWSSQIDILGSVVRGKVILEKVNTADGDYSGVMVTVKNGGSVVASVYTSADGTYSFTDLPPGGYTFEYLKPGWSKAVRANIEVTTGADKTLPDLTLLIGDMNSDTFINVQDLLWMAGYIGKRPGDPAWPAAEIADVNGDTYVNVQDLIRVAANIGKKPE